MGRERMDAQAAELAAGLRYFAPSPRLAQLVTVIFVWTGLAPAHEGLMPSIDGQIAIRLAGDARLSFGGGAALLPPHASVFGSLGQAAHMTTSAGFRSVGAGLSARGWRAMVGVPADVVADGIVDLSALWGGPAVRELLMRLDDAVDDTARAAVLDQALCARLAGDRRIDARVALIDDWLAGSPALSLEALADRLDLSRRQVERLTLTTHGFSPKLLAMKHRALRAATRLATEPPDRLLNEEWGYTDQSHMIRDFRRFIGTTPAKLLSRAHATRHVLRAPEEAGASLSVAKV